MDWVWNEAQSSGNPSVANLVIGGGASLAIDHAVASVSFQLLVVLTTSYNLLSAYTIWYPRYRRSRK